MRTSEKQKIIDSDPKYKLFDLIMTKGTGQVNECRNGHIWRTHKVKNGVDSWKVWVRVNGVDKVFKRGVSK